jgi:hypothetical protein
MPIAVARRASAPASERPEVCSTIEHEQELDERERDERPDRGDEKPSDHTAETGDALAVRQAVEYSREEKRDRDERSDREHGAPWSLEPTVEVDRRRHRRGMCEPAYRPCCERADARTDGVGEGGEQRAGDARADTAEQPTGEDEVARHL